MTSFIFINIHKPTTHHTKALNKKIKTVSETKCRKEKENDY
jgi:hypothetical protein